MNRILTIVLLLVAGLLVAPVAPATAHEERPVHHQEQQQKPPKYRAYEYRGTFTVELKHHVELAYAHEGDGKFIDASASLTGRIPSLTFTKPDGRVVATLDTLAATVKAQSGSVDSTTITDEGRKEVRCVGDSIWKTNKEHPFLLVDGNGRSWFRAFSILSLPQTCRDNQGGEPTTSVHSFPELPAHLKSKDTFGAKTITFPLRAARNFPRAAGQTKDCPDSAQSLTVACSYELTGSIELTRVRSYRPVVPRERPTFLYDATFKADVTHHLELQYYDERDGKFVDASATVSGRIPRMRVQADHTHEGYLVMDMSKATVKAGTGAVDSTMTTSRGEIEERCEGSSIWRTDDQRPYLSVTTALEPLFYPFAQLSLPQTCRDNQGSEPTESVHSLPVRGIPIHRSTGQIGDRRMVYTFVTEERFPRSPGDDEECLDEVRTLTVACTYAIKGRMVLTRVKRLR